MQLSRSGGSFGSSFSNISSAFTGAFPRPRVLVPTTVGVDISDADIKWIVLEGKPGAKRVHSYGREELAPGAIVNGSVQNIEALAEGLRAMKQKLRGIECAHAALPEEAAFVFSMHVPEGSSREQTLSIIEFELEGRVPITAQAAVFDFDVITSHDQTGDEIGVVVFPKELSENYDAAFEGAGLKLLSLELEASSIARAVREKEVEKSITLLVDFGRLRTGFAVLKRGVPIFTSTVAVGGDSIDKAITEKLALSEEEATRFKNEEGLIAEKGSKSKGLEAIAGTASALADEVARHFHYWDTRRNEHGERMTPVEQVYLVGGSANLKGLQDYIAARVQARTIRPDIWRNVCSYDEYIPPIDRRTSLQYATAIGLALRNR